jgi:hypothetical protein
MKAVHSDTISYKVFKEYFQTVKFKYSSGLNYQNCSANFEFTINYQANGALVKFAAMNKNATSYQWEIVGFGNPIYITTPTMSHLYPYPSPFEKTFPWLVVLRTNDSVNNCGDTLTQSIIIQNPNYSILAGIKENNKSNFSIFPNPVNSFVTIDMENYSYQEQIAICHNAQYVVGPHGAGLTNILFMKKNSTLLELSAKDDEDFFNGFYILANMLEHNYLYQKCAIGQNSFIQDSHHSSLNVDLERLERNIKIMLNNNNV